MNRGLCLRQIILLGVINNIKPGLQAVQTLEKQLTHPKGQETQLFDSLSQPISIGHPTKGRHLSAIVIVDEFEQKQKESLFG